jgi:hypothetical protein
MMKFPHLFAMHGHLLGSGFLLFLMALALVVIIVTWPSKTEPK